MADTKKTKVVRYNAPFHFSEREITADDWAKVGAEGQATAIWNRANGWEIPASDFSAAALKYVEVDKDLEVVEA